MPPLQWHRIAIPIPNPHFWQNNFDTYSNAHSYSLGIWCAVLLNKVMYSKMLRRLECLIYWIILPSLIRAENEQMMHVTVAGDDLTLKYVTPVDVHYSWTELRTLNWDLCLNARFLVVFFPLLSELRPNRRCMWPSPEMIWHWNMESQLMFSTLERSYVLWNVTSAWLPDFLD